jgi:PAS domain S-box-containing protein
MPRYIVAAVAVGVAFVALPDWHSPSVIAAGLVHCAIAAPARLLRKPKFIWTAALACSAIAIGGNYVAFANGQLWLAAVASAFVLLVIWIFAAVLVLARRGSGEQTIVQEDVRQSEERFRAAVESAPAAMVMSDAAGRITLVNAQAEVLFGYTRAELLERHVEVLVPERFRVAHPGLRAGFFARPEARRMGVGRDLYGLRKDGSEFPVEIGLNPIRTAEGLFVLSAIVDITERKKGEALLRNANEELERRVAERTAALAQQARALAQSRDALERSNIELQRFAYIASHDLQTPLRSISGFTQLLQQTYAGKLDARADDWIRRTVENAKRMQDLIQDLLSYARIDSAARPLEAVDCRHALSEALDMLQARVSERNASVTYGPLPSVIGDARQVAQLFQNLIDNAITYQADGAPPQVHVSSEQVDNEYVFSVRDNGIGIDPRYQARIFEVFQRLHTQRVYPGTGIGLAVCRRIVHRHGGRIWVESQPGEGSVFRFTLPRKEAMEHE